MYFQVTPPSRPKHRMKTTAGSKTARDPEIVTIALAPFTPNSKVFFEDIPLHSTANRQVVVQNPSSQNVEVNISKLTPEERQVKFSWTKSMLPANSQEILNIQWIPIKEGTWIDSVSFESGRRLKKDMQIVFKSINSNKGVKSKRPGAKKSPITVVLKRIKSPIKTYGLKKALPSNNKENELYLSGIQKFTSPSSVTFNISDHVQFGRETYLVDKPKILENHVKYSNNVLNNLTVNNSFSPKQCSTGKKSKHLLTPDICLNLNNIGNLSNASTETYVIDNDLKNLSSETYVKNTSDRNLSAGTYVKANVSDIAEDSLEGQSNSFEDSLKALQILGHETNTRHAIQTDFKGSILTDSSIKKYLNLESAGVKQALQASLWSNQKPKHRDRNTFEDDLLGQFRPRASSSGNRKRKSDTIHIISPIKKVNNSVETKTWSKVGVVRKVGKVATQRPSSKKLFKVQMEEAVLKQTMEEKATISHNTEDILSAINTLHSASTTLNPFVTTTYIYDPQWLDEQEACFKRWFNVLLVPHSELKTYSESVDVARIWQQCLRKEVNMAPTKEEVSQQYHVNIRLDTLRKAALDLYQSPTVAVILHKVLGFVQSGRLEIRRDRNVHQDLSLQYEITRLFLSYNSLWLRIGLETIFGSMIPLKSNSDIIGLTLFIKDRLFKDTYLIRKHKTTHSPKYCVEIKIHILNKFLSFVFFLDQAKLRKLIPHDPCLFVKSGEFKESREILLHFAKEVIASIGDITRFLKPSRYELSYKQTYIHEFDYAVAHLAADLRDGVRLAKVVEIIILEQGLTEMLRVPAISRIQKIYNVKVSFDALEKAGFRIMEDITPVDIVNGHKEKTLTFLWQIVNKFQVPRFTKAAVTVQEWFRSLTVIIKRKTLAKKWFVKDQAARIIQTWYRKFLASRISFIERRHIAATKIQSYYKMWKGRSVYLKLRKFALFAQSQYRMLLAKQTAGRKLYAIVKIQAFAKGHLQRKRFKSLREAVIVIERRYIANKIMCQCRTNYKTLKSTVLLLEDKFLARKAMETVRQAFLYKRQAAVTLQIAFKSYIRMNKTRNEYLSLKNAAICIQHQFRANVLMKQQRTYYCELRVSAVNVQKWWRAFQAMKQCRKDYLFKIKCIVTIQRHFKTYLKMATARRYYLNARRIVVFMQRKFRANKARDTVRGEYIRTREAVITIQHHFRAYQEMLKQRQIFISLRIATLTIQWEYRAQKMMRNQRSSYLSLKQCAIKMQRRLRANKVAKQTSTEYRNLKNSVIYIQRIFRANRMMKKDQQEFHNLRDASIVIQRRFRAIVLMREQRLSFLQTVYCAALIQNYYRSYKLTLRTRMKFCFLRQSVLVVQRRFRANKLMRHHRTEYLLFLKAVKIVQQRYRAQLQMHNDRKYYTALKKVTKMVQSRLRAKKSMQLQQTLFLNLKQSALIIQRRYRAIILMREQRARYQHIRNSVIDIQRYYRSYKETQKTRNNFFELRRIVLNMQSRFRAKKSMRKQRAEFLLFTQSTKIIQKRYRAQLQMRYQRNHYLSLKSVAEMIQSRYRARMAMRIQLKQFQHLKECTMLIQSKYRASMLMKQQRSTYLILYESVVKIQRYYRCFKLTVRTQNKYYQLKKAVLNIQMRFRAKLQMKKQRFEYVRLLYNVKVVQERYRAQVNMRTTRCHYVALKNVTEMLQSKYRARKAMRTEQKQFQYLRGCAILIQRKYRATISMRQQSHYYHHILTSIVKIQRNYRSYKLTQQLRGDFCEIRRTIVIIQKRFRAKQLMKKQRSDYLLLLKAVTNVQQRLRAQLNMRKERLKYVKIRCAAIKIQNHYRSYKEVKKTRCDYCQLRASVVTIQIYFRTYRLMKKQRSEYLLLLKASKCIQRRYRAQIKMRLERDHYKALRTFTNKIQSRYRAIKAMKIDREQFLELRRACLIVQRRFKSNQLMRIDRNNYTQLKRVVLYVEANQKAKVLARKEMHQYQSLRGTIIGLQTFSRGYMARKKFSYIFDEEYRLQRKEEIRRATAVKKIQALWRGFRTRSDGSDDMQRIQNVRQRARILSKAAVTNITLGEKHRDLITGISRNSFMKIITTLKDLDYIARHSQKSCESCCALLPDYLYLIVISSKRSISDKEAIELATRLIITLYKFSPNNSTYQAHHLDRMVTVMNHFCDKEGQVFLNIATLFWLFAQNKQRRRDILVVPNLRQRLIKIKDLIERKIKMVAKAPHSLQSVFVNCSDIAHAYLPYLLPDWGLDYAHRPHSFTNIKHALQMLFQTLNLS